MKNTLAKDDAIHRLLDRIIEAGWLATLSKPQLGTLMAYAAYADPRTSLSSVGAARIGEMIGVKSLSHVYRARTDLQKLSLLKLQRKGGGRDAAVFKLIFPGPPRTSKRGHAGAIR